MKGTKVDRFTELIEQKRSLETQLAGLLDQKKKLDAELAPLIDAFMGRGKRKRRTKQEIAASK